VAEPASQSPRFLSDALFRCGVWIWSRRSVLPLVLVALALIGINYAWRFSILKTREFDTDEFQHLHSAWCISKGLVPYRDYYEHHTPTLHYLLAFFQRFYDVEHKPDEAVAFILFARRLMWVFTGAILSLTFCLARSWKGHRGAWIAALLLTNIQIFFLKTIEIRPDLMSVPLLLASIWAFLCGAKSRQPTLRRTSWQFFACGGLIGMAILCTPKVLFAGPSMALAFLWYISDPRGGGTFLQRLRNGFTACLGLCLPLLVAADFFAMQNSLGEFIEDNFLMNLRWKHHFSSAENFASIVHESPIETALALTGFARVLLHVFSSASVRRGDYILVLNGLGLFLGTFFIPVPYRQYHLMYLPFGAIFAGQCLTDVVDAGAALRLKWRRWRWFHWLEGVALFSLLIKLLLYCVGSDHPNILDAGHFGIIWACTLVIAVPLALFGLRNTAAALLLPALCVHPLDQITDVAQQRNDEALREVRFIIENSAPTETVLDGWTLHAPFRPHAYFYYFLHEELRMMLTEDDRLQFLNGVRSGLISPKFIFLDGDLSAYCPAAVPYFNQHYSPTDIGPIWVRKTPTPLPAGDVVH